MASSVFFFGPFDHFLGTKAIPLFPPPFPPFFLFFVPRFFTDEENSNKSLQDQRGPHRLHAPSAGFFFFFFPKADGGLKSAFTHVVIIT